MEKRILMGHGSGGRLTHQLIQEILLRSFDNRILAELEDSAVFDYQCCRWAFTTDSYVIKPLFFPGGDIGRLAVCGTMTWRYWGQNLFTSPRPLFFNMVCK